MYCNVIIAFFFYKRSPRIKKQTKQKPNSKRKWINKMARCPWWWLAIWRWTVWKARGAKDRQSETCHRFLCPSFCVSLFFPASQHGSIFRRGETPIRTCGSCHPLLMPPPTLPPPPPPFCFLSPLPVTSPPSPHLRLLAVFDRVPFQCARATLAAIKPGQVCMFAASLFLLRWSKSAPCATEKGFNSRASYCSLLLMLHTK